MATLADSLVSSTSRAVKLRMRPDLTARKHRYHGQIYWVVKEPIGLNYFRFHEEEFAILNMLDGRTSLDDIKQEFEATFTPQKITFGDLQQFVGMLHRNGLVISEASGQGKQLRRRRDEKKWRELMGMLANVFALRFRGVALQIYWLVFPLADGHVRNALCTERIVAGARAVRHILRPTSIVPSVLWPSKLVLSRHHDGGREGASRIWPRAKLQTLWRRVPRTRRNAARVYSGALLQRVRLLDAAQQVASGGDRRGRHVC
jgi:hypothetical protein